SCPQQHAVPAGVQEHIGHQVPCSGPTYGRHSYGKMMAFELSYGDIKPKPSYPNVGAKPRQF
ncbi:hypothetical protein N9X05_04125, partial [Paracoccaceae bacterium]|nr:hypothetical protein [Paracoccaceae bacterium]